MDLFRKDPAGQAAQAETDVLDATVPGAQVLQVVALLAE